MLNNRHCLCIRIFQCHGNDVRALDALLGVVERMQVSRHGQGHTHHSHALSFFVHHLEHDLHTIALFTHEITDAFSVGAEVQSTGGVAVDTHFAFDVAALHIVGFSQFALFIETDLGNHKDGNSLRAGRVTFDAGQHRMNNILCQVMISGRNETLGANDGISTVSIPFSCSFQDAQVRPRTRFGQAHCASPLAGEHLFDDNVTQGVFEVIFHQPCRAMAQTGIHEKRLIGSQKHVGNSSPNNERKGLAANFR